MTTKQWPSKPRSNFSWQHLSAREADNGQRWQILWDVVRGPGSDGRSTAVEKTEGSALERARHLLRMGFVVYEIREPSGGVFLDETGLRDRFGYEAIAT